jgi:hypothetical protein
MATPNLTDWANAAAVDAVLKYADVANKSVLLGAGTSIDLAAGRSFSKTLTANTTLTITNVPADGTFVRFNLILKNLSSYTITLWANINWPGGVTPTLPSNSSVIFDFITVDGGASYVGSVLADDVYAPWWKVEGLSSGDFTAIYQPKGAAILADSYINILNPGTNDAAPGVAPTLDSDGWVFNGSSQYLVGPASSSAGFAVRFSDASLTGRFVVGATATGRVGFNPDSGADKRVYYNTDLSTAGTVVNGAITSGVVIINGTKGALNGAVEAVISGTFAETLSYYIGAQNVNGSVGGRQPCKIQAICFFAPGTTLTDAQISALSAAMAAL